MTNNTNKYWILVLILAVGGTYYFLSKKQEKERRAFEETVTAEIKKLGNSLQAGGNIVSYQDLEKRMEASLGKKVTEEIRKTNGTLASLTTAIGEVKGQIVGLKPQTGTFENGSFKIELEQNRLQLPPLSSINLNYDATKPGLTGLTGNWKNYTEVFTMAFGEWRTSQDGVRSAVTLKRDVYKDSEKKEKLGSENIELGNAESYFSTDKIYKISTPPKYMVILGSVFDLKTGKKYPSFIFDTKINRSIGISTGYINKNYLLGFSYTFGHQ